MYTYICMEFSLYYRFKKLINSLFLTALIFVAAHWPSLVLERRATLHCRSLASQCSKPASLVKHGL